MVRCGALARCSCINGGLQGITSRLLSQLVFKPELVIGSCQFSSSTVSPASGTKASEADRLNSIADLRREYEKQASKLRKRYTAELEEKKMQKGKGEEELQKKFEEVRAIRVLERKQRAASRAIEVAEEERILKEAMEEQRVTRAEHRARVEGRQGYIRFKRMQEIRRQSSMWVEEKDLERRILEAIANPYHLAGSSGSMEPIDRDDSYYEDNDL